MAAGANTASPPVLTPGSNHQNREEWQRTVEGATYQRQEFIKRIDEFNGRPYTIGHVRKWARVDAVALASTAVGHSTLTYQDPKGTEITFTPAGVYIALAWSRNEGAATDVQFDSELTDEAEQAMAEANDKTVMLNITSGTQFRGNGTDDVNAALIRNSVGLLVSNTNGMVQPGQTTIYGMLDSSQYGPLMSVPEITSAQLRGDSENPNVKGMVATGYGVTWLLSTVCPANVDGGVAGCIWIPSAFVIGWNERTQILRQDFELQNRLFLFNHFGSTVKHDLRFVQLKTGNVIPV